MEWTGILAAFDRGPVLAEGTMEEWRYFHKVGCPGTVSSSNDVGGITSHVI